MDFLSSTCHRCSNRLRSGEFGSSVNTLNLSFSSVPEQFLAVVRVAPYYSPVNDFNLMADCVCV